jgi:hypothetical protein
VAEPPLLKYNEPRPAPTQLIGYVEEMQLHIAGLCTDVEMMRTALREANRRLAVAEEHARLRSRAVVIAADQAVTWSKKARWFQTADLGEVEGFLVQAGRMKRKRGVVEEEEEEEE